MAWTGNLSYYDSVRGVTWTEWRLPDVYSLGYNGTSGELECMYYVNLVNLGYYDSDGHYQPGWGLNNTGFFNNLQAWSYWSRTEKVNSTDARYMNFKYGYASYDNKSSYYYSWAVMDGDVGVVPIPSAIWLLGSGLIGVVGSALSR